EGTDTNHLIDLFAVAVVMIGGAAAREMSANGGRFKFAAAAPAGATLGPSLSALSRLINRKTQQRWGNEAEAVCHVTDSSRPILAETPIVSVARHEQPYVLDPFMYRMIRERDPKFGEGLWEKLRQRQFSAIILDRDPHTERGRDWYTYFFGQGFVT